MKTRNNKKHPENTSIPGEEQSPEDSQTEDVAIPPHAAKPRKRPEYQSITKLLFLIPTSIKASLEDREIMKCMSKHGYDEAGFQVVLELVNQVELLHKQQGDSRIIKELATQKKIEIGKEAEKLISRFVKTAHLAFENDPEMLEKFKSPGKRNQSFFDWLEKGKVFYLNALSSPGAIDGFNKYQVTRQDLEAGKQKLMDAETQSTVQFGLDADRQVVTDQLAVAYSRLKSWWAEYKKIARIALKNTPQSMEKLGIAVPTRK